MTILSSGVVQAVTSIGLARGLDGAWAKMVSLFLPSPIYRAGKIVNGFIVTSPNCQSDHRWASNIAAS